MTPDPYLQIYAVGAAVIGFLTCFYGFLLFEYLLGAVGFLVGAAVGASLAVEMSAGNLGALLGGGLIGGIAGALLFVYMFSVALALMGFLLGAFAGSTLNSMAALEMGRLLVLLLGAGGAVLALLFKKLFIVLSTSFDGAAALVWGGLVLFRTFEMVPGVPEQARRDVIDSPKLTALWIATGLLGVLVQYRVTAPDRYHLRRLEEEYWQEDETPSA